jgi:rRNA-processing protein FCF1
MSSAPVRYLLDSNAFDDLAEHEADRRLAVATARSASVAFFTTYAQEAELAELASRKPDKYWRIASIPRAIIASSVFVLGHTRLGSGRLGGGATYDAVRRGPRHVDDGVIADTAHAEGMVLVTNERRLRNRATTLGVDALKPADLLVKLRQSTN